MKENYHMTPLTEDELQNIYGGSFFGAIFKWLKTHFFHEKTDEHSNESLNTHGYNGTHFVGTKFNI